MQECTAPVRARPVPFLGETIDHLRKTERRLAVPGQGPTCDAISGRLGESSTLGGNKPQSMGGGITSRSREPREGSQVRSHRIGRKEGIGGKSLVLWTSRGAQVPDFNTGGEGRDQASEPS